ncbi:MAG TPA: ATP-binding protein [Thermoanaerobaculia bacterium]|nr:ATP-binding protein [Thermoanaerobaculia bacterium]
MLSLCNIPAARMDRGDPRDLEIARLRASERRYRDFFDRNPTAVFWNTLEGRILECSDAAVRLYGFSSKEDLLATPAAELYARPADRGRLVADLARDERIIHRELRLKRRDGSEFWGLASVCLVPGAVGEPPMVEACVVDITERKELEERLSHTQKLEAVGKLAGGVAHDFNNLLTTILGYSEILLKQLPHGAPHREDLREIQRAGERAAVLTRQLLAFSRKQVVEPHVLDLNAVVRDASKMLRRLVGEDLKLVLRLEASLGHVRADVGQLEQVLMNLTANARDAMPDGGSIDIATRNVFLGEDDRRVSPFIVAGRYAELTVGDTGTGIDAEARAHVFEPFFTTKERGKGTGLGLAMVYGIVKQSGGFVWALDRPGGGTTLRICLPVVDEPVTRRPPSPGEGLKSLKGTQTILVVEDEETVRSLSYGVLLGAGYTVLVANDGASALEVARTFGGEIHLVVTDVVMPGMSGRDLASRLLDLRPGVKVLYVSGYTDEKIAAHGVLEPGTHFLQKPFTPSVLVRRVHDLLGGR